MIEREEIKVLWEGPFSIEQILQKDGIDSKKYEVKASDIGLYQIYGCHPLYGDNVLVYIGRTKGKKGFRSRLKNRWVIENGSDAENVQIYLGTIMSDLNKLSKDEILSKKLIDKAEILLINAHKPAYNSSNIQSAHDDFIDGRYMIHNEGNYRRLAAVLDSKYFWEKYANYKIVELIADVTTMEIEDEDEYYGVSLNDYFDVNAKYKIWFGVDYEIWEVEKVPLMFQIYSEDKLVMEKIRKSGKYTFYKYADNDELLDCFYIDNINFNADVDKETLLEEFKNHVNNIKTAMNEILQ
ncbi:hypothetical protein [Sulfurimonas sp. HSL3-7]|uniref:hypothetical protein n=1 Tax=Sulfonitrofixus jiaomeiensis TaxID=3131938 RepID=UPI0031FA0B31